MKSPHGCKCDECRSIEMVLQELDHMAPVKIAMGERELIRAIVE